VLAVAKRAINDIIIPPTGPSISEATSLKGAEEEAISSNGKMLTMDIAVKQYKTVVIIIEYIIARGRFLVGSLTSSAIFAISSNPMYAKNIKATAEKTAPKEPPNGSAK